jgi:hypothetical protein
MNGSSDAAWLRTSGFVMKDAAIARATLQVCNRAYVPAIARDIVTVLMGHPVPGSYDSSVIAYRRQIIDRIRNSPYIQGIINAGLVTDQAAIIAEQIMRRCGIPSRPVSAVAVEDALMPGDTNDAQFDQDVGAAIRGARLCGRLVLPSDAYTAKHLDVLSTESKRMGVAHVLAASDAIFSLVPGRLVPYPDHAARVPVPDDDGSEFGGYDGFSNHGRPSGIVPSEFGLADDHEEIDPFIARFVTNELLYFNRDDNRQWRTRRKVLIRLDDSLIGARVKDASLNWQRGILALATIRVCCERLATWLSADDLDIRVAVPANLDRERGALELCLLGMPSVTMGTFDTDDMNPKDARIDILHIVSRRRESAPALKDDEPADSEVGQSWLTVDERASHVCGERVSEAGHSPLRAWQNAAIAALNALI